MDWEGGSSHDTCGGGEVKISRMQLPLTTHACGMQLSCQPPAALRTPLAPLHVSSLHATTTPLTTPGLRKPPSERQDFLLALSNFANFEHQVHAQGGVASLGRGPE